MILKKGMLLKLKVYLPIIMTEVLLLRACCCMTSSLVFVEKLQL